MKRRILYILLTIAVIAVTQLLLGFAIKHNQQNVCGNIKVYVDQKCGNRFIDPEDVERTIVDRMEGLVGQPIGQGTLIRIKQLVEGNPYVEKAAIYRSMEGDLHIEIKQHQPLIRVINSKNQSYYISRSGIMMPVSRSYAARVMVAIGNIHAGYSQTIDLTSDDDTPGITIGEQQLRSLFQLATTIDKNPFWKSMIDQIYVTSNGQYELTPMNGAHTIEFGNLERMHEKFEKLETFYKVGLSEVGWNYYNRINLKYEKQVVCSK